MADDVNTTDGNETGDGGNKKRSGKGSSGSGGGIRLPPNKLKEIMANWEQLDLAKTVARVAEFFSELPARASANMRVDWASMSRHGFAVVNHLISSGQEIAHFMRERTAGHVKKLRTKYGVNIKAANNTQYVAGFNPNVT